MQSVNMQIFEQFPVIKTKRLTLREFRISDAQKLFEMRSNGRMNEFINRERMHDQDASIKLAEKVIQNYKDKLAIGWVGVLRENDDLIGACGYNQIDFPNLHAEIGGELCVDYWGKNIAIEAVAGIIKFGLETMNLHTIEAKVNPANRGSIFLMEKLGFKKEAHFVERVYFKGKFSDMAVYTLIKGNQSYSW